MSYGGLRGGVGIALALTLYAEIGKQISLKVWEHFLTTIVSHSSP